MDRNISTIHRILEEAAHVVRREKETARDVEPSEGYKGRQIQRLKEFATSRHLWIDFDKNQKAIKSKYNARLYVKTIGSSCYYAEITLSLHHLINHVLKEKRGRYSYRSLLFI